MQSRSYLAALHAKRDQRHSLLPPCTYAHCKGEAFALKRTRHDIPSWTAADLGAESRSKCLARAVANLVAVRLRLACAAVFLAV